jgi:hypothetical protein
MLTSGNWDSANAQNKRAGHNSARIVGPLLHGLGAAGPAHVIGVLTLDVAMSMLGQTERNGGGGRQSRSYSEKGARRLTPIPRVDSNPKKSPMNARALRLGPVRSRYSARMLVRGFKSEAAGSRKARRRGRPGQTVHGPQAPVPQRDSQAGNYPDDRPA